MDGEERDWPAGKWIRAGLACLMFSVVLALYPGTIDATGPVKTLVLGWGAFLTTVALLGGSLLTNRRMECPGLILAFLAGLLVLNALSCVLSRYVGHSLIEMRRHTTLFLLCLTASQVYRTPTQVARLMTVVCAAVLLSTLYAFCQRAGWDPFPWADPESPLYKELPGTFGNPNYAVHVLIPCIIMAGYLASRRRGLWCLGFLPFFLAHVFFTGQRAGKVGIVAAALLLLVAWCVSRWLRRPIPRIAVTLGTFVLLAMLGVFLVSGIVKARTGSYLPLDWPLRLRYNAYDSSARMILDRPVLGWGPGNYVIENTPYWTDFEQEWFATRRKLNEHVHCDMLEIGVDAGIPGMACYVSAFVAGITGALFMAFSAKTRDRQRLGYAFAAFFCAFFVDGLFGFNLRVPVSAALFFLMAGAFDGVTRTPKQTPDPPRLRTGAVAWRLTVIALSLLLAIMHSRLFASEQAMYHGRTAMAQRTFDLAEERFAKGEALCPSNWISAHERARASMRAGHAEQAAIHFQRALDKNPHYIVTLIGLARTKMNLALAVPPHEAARQAQLLDEAQDFAEQARTLCPIMSEADDILGRTASVRAVGFQIRAQADETLREALAALWQEAETRLTGALAKKTDNQCQLRCMLAQARIGLQNGPGAEQAFADAVRATPESSDAWAAFARFARASKHPHAFQELARNTIDAELTSDTPDEGLIAALALHVAQLEQSTFQDPETIESAYALAVRHAPAQPEIWSAFALFSKKTRRSEAFKEAALRVHRDLRAKGIQPIPALSAASQAWEGGGPALASATGDLMRAIKAHPAQKNVNTLRLEFGWAAEVLLKEVERAGATLENRGVALLNLGTILMRLGNPKLAEMVLAVAQPALPDQQKSLCMQYRAEVLSHLNRHAEAAHLLRSLLHKNPEDLKTRLALARALTQARKVSEARTQYEAILASPLLNSKAREPIQKELRALKSQ